MYNFAIIVIGYNRVDSIRRLLNSVENAYYSGYNVTLIISIDNSGKKDVEKFAKDFKWSHGEKKVITYERNLGLKKHILKCSNMVKDYDAVAILEDDVVVSPGFFLYMEATYKKYHNDNRIAGVSLYNYRWNENVSLPFEADISEFDVYFMQMSQSWGQIIFKKQWEEFERWYNNNKEKEVKQKNVPEVVYKWPSSSWKKYHIKFCIDNNKFMVFPYKSLSTCYSDVGVHSKIQYTYLQVPLLNGVKDKYNLPELTDKNSVIYDAFFERIINNTKNHEILYDDVCMDLYASKTYYEDKKYLLTTKSLPYHIEATFGLLLKPQEQNVIQQVPGNEIKMYNLKKSEKTKRNNIVKTFRYRYSLYDKNRMLIKCVWSSFCEKVKSIKKKK